MERQASSSLWLLTDSSLGGHGLVSTRSLALAARPSIGGWGARPFTAEPRNPRTEAGRRPPWLPPCASQGVSRLRRSARLRTSTTGAGLRDTGEERHRLLEDRGGVVVEGGDVVAVGEGALGDVAGGDLRGDVGD